jgi:hypothetical protein
MISQKEYEKIRRLNYVNPSANRLGITRCVLSARPKASGLRPIFLGIFAGPGFDDIV